MTSAGGHDGARGGGPAELAALAALREREALMAEAEALAHVGSYLWQPGQALVWSDGMFRVLGYVPGELAPGGEAFFARVHPDDRERVLRAQVAATEGELPDIEYRILRADTGETRFIRGVVRVDVDATDGQTRRMVGALLDVTDSKQSALRDEQALVTLRAAEQLGKIGTFVVRLDPEEIHWSQGLRELTGLYDRDADAVARFRLIHRDDRERYMRWWNELLANQSAAPIQMRIIRPDGALRHLLTHAAAVRFEADGVERVLGSVADVTERVVLEEHLRHAAKMEAVGTLAAGVAHDFNNYMMVIAGCLDLLAQPGAADISQKDLTAHARHALERCMDLTQQLLAFGRRQPSRSEVVDLCEAAQRIVALLQPTLGRSVRIELQAAKGPVHARIDPAHLEQVLANLAINARDAIADAIGELIGGPAGDRGRIVIRIECVELAAPEPRAAVAVPDGRWARMEVTDDGTGIAEEHLPRIFDPYFTTKALGRGSGLGLSSVYGAVLQHGGHVTVATKLGDGTTFSVWLPAAEAGAISVAPSTRSSRPATRVRRVLLVDDLREVRHVTALTLSMAGFEVGEAADGLEALALIEAERFDLVLSDVRMPRMGGVELARVLAERRPGLPVLLMSGFTDFPDSSGSVTVLDKPIAAERLIAEISRRLE